MKVILFLCTGNYYRSRFAEEVFNHVAQRDGIGWRALSRALAIEKGIYNIGPISPFALAGLKTRGIVAQGVDRYPRQCEPQDLASADHIVVLSDVEHRPLVRDRFPDWDARIEYWEIGDIGILSPDTALESIAANVAALLRQYDAVARA